MAWRVWWLRWCHGLAGAGGRTSVSRRALRPGARCPGCSGRRQARAGGKRKKPPKRARALDMDSKREQQRQQKHEQARHRTAMM
jgi:hypothetical protein